ncbi:hypothetical protein [Streptomyces sp. NPDC046862]|uniref:hypothetical protein n=1 Tax=Streptomyces sp. NPDC046862 TaxID=3154603 RepID=UPI003456F3EC
MRSELDRGIGHYMASVAEHLLAEGLPVSSIAVYSDFTDETQNSHQKDVEGSIYFTSRFETALLGGPGTAQLHWCAVSGWCLVLMPGTPSAGGRSFRWLGEGLWPVREAVARFVLTMRADPRSKSSERPLYRSPGADLEGLADRLMMFVPEPDSPGKGDYLYRFARRLSETYRDRIGEALLAPQQDRVQVVLASGELEALRLMSDFVEATEVVSEGGSRALPPGPGSLAHLMANDLTRRGQHSDNPHDAADTYREAQDRAIADRNSFEGLSN